MTRSQLPTLFPRYNIAPTQPVLSILERDTERESALLQWGLIPSWSSTAKGWINARAETLTERRTFSEAFQSRRCLIPADGFYEWKRSGRVKQPYYFQMKDEAPFAFAGIWDQWRHGELSITSCAIITTTPNELLAEIHDRMPVILKPESYGEWLAAATPADNLPGLLAPFPSAAMKGYPVSSEVNYVKNDNEDLVKPAVPATEPQGRLF